ncbi:TIGR04388 family protein [Leptospira noguchii]|uniref:TIGR04388 family protein n=1 Tax=Leptospira noguchii TaxID=28182 RepID=UPI001FB66875|nr:TIGR04388 family protein [Leptospira noguchii]UOG50969.1 TIGR04388 family protein [Leptospira noguchii]
MQNTETKGRGLKKMNLFLKKSITESENRAVAKNETFNKQNIQETENRFSFKTKIVSLITILAFHVSFVLPFAIFSFLFSASSSLEAQSVPVLGSTKQFANDELKPYVDAAKASSMDSATFLNSVNNGEQVIEAAWETSVNAEIEAIVGGVTNSDSVNNVNVYKDAVRAQLELQKQQAKNQWIADANAYIQAELQIFLAVLSQNTSNNVTSSNTNAVNTVNPTVQAVTTTPASQGTNPAQAAQSYYQGSQLWDSKWQDLLSKQSTWEQNSLNSIQNGILQWNQSITGLENDKLAYLNGIEQTKAQWLANKQLIQNAQSQMRSALQSTITNIRNQENQLKNSASSDPSLVAVFGDMDGLLDDLQDALNSNSSLGTLAETLGNFFQSQISNATAKADYWNITKWQETYATQVLEFKKEVATANLSCSGGPWCNYQPTGSHTVTYNADGNVYGWAATNGGFQSGVLVSSFDPYTTANPMYEYCQQNPGSLWCLISPPSSPTITVDPNASTGYYSEGHYVIECNGIELFGNTCSGAQGYTNTGDYCGNAPVFCGYNKRWQTDYNYSTSVSESFSQAQKDQIAKNNNIRNAVLGSYNTAFGLSSQAGNAVAGSNVALETKVYLGGTTLNSSNWYGSMGLVEQVQVQTKYKYIDSAMQANQNFWTSMKTQFTNIASTFLSLVNPLKNWEERSEEYEDEYQAKLLELEQTKQSTISNYDNQINQMKAARGAWVTEVYGYQIAGIAGSSDNANSQYRSGQENWSDTISVFQQAELNWYLSAKDTLQQAVTSPNGETQFQTSAITQANQIQTQITNSETNTTQLYNAATGLYQSYQYAASGNLMNQALTNLQNQTNWNQQGANLSASIADSFGRSESYKTAELNASNRINALAQTIYGNGAYIVDNTELQTLQTQITTNGQNQTNWQNEINGNNGGFNFNGRRATSISTTLEYTNIRNDISVATTLQEEVVDEEKGYLKTANEYFEKSEKYQELAEKAKSEAKFDEAALYTGYAVREKGNAITFLKKKYNGIGEEITGEVDNRGLTYTRNSFLSYRDTLLNKNFQNSTQVQKQIQEGKNQVAGIITEGENYNQIQGMLQSAQNLNQQGAENKERVEKLLAQSKELAEKNIGEGLLDGLQEMIASIQSSLPQEVSNNGVSQYIQAQEKELAEKQEKANELLSHMNSLVTNNNDLAALQALLQGSSQGLNLAANSAVSKYLDDYAKKLQKDNEERSSNLQKTLLESLTNGDDYKYLRDAGYGFRVDGEGITAYREVYSGEIEINGSAMKSTSYSPDLEYQYIRIDTKFNPGNLSVDMLNPNNTTFSAEMVSGVKSYIDNLQKNVEVMFAQFSDKTKEVKEEYVQNEEIESYQKKLYEASKENYLAAFQGLPGEFKEMFEGEMGGLKGYHEQGSKYNFGQGSFKGQSGDMKKIGKSMYDGAIIDDTVFAGSRELKGSVSVKGIPVEVSYGMQYLIVTSGFEISNLGYNFNLKGLGTSYVDNQLSGANQKYEIYKEDISARIEKQAKANDAEKESKGFIFTILNGMNGGSGSMGQRFTQAVRSEAQSRITGAVAEATGLPASLVGALVGGSSMKDAVKAYVKDETTNAISKATGLPTWLISNQMEKMNKPKEQWYQSQEFQMVTTVAAVVAAPLTGGASLMVMMAVNAGLGAATGAAGGGLKGALVGAVGGAAGAAVRSFTGGAVTVGLSYSAENGFGASVGVGYGPATVSVGVSEKGGATVDLGFTKGGFNAGLSYNSKTGSVSGNAGLEVAKGTSLGISYNEGDGFGASISKSLENGVNGSLSWSQKGGVGGSIGYEVPGDKNKSKDSLANKMQGAGGSLNFSQRDGVSAAFNASGGVNAGNWSQSGGFQANTNFLNDKWKADFVSKQSAIEELQSKGLSKEQATAILDAQAKADSKAAQNKNNEELGAQVIQGAGRREGEDSADPVDQRINQLKKELSEGISLADGNGTMSDAGGGSGEAAAAKELSKKMAELQKLEGQKAAGQKPGVQKDGSIVVVERTSRENKQETQVSNDPKANSNTNIKPGEIGYSILNFSAVLGVGPNLTKTEMTDHTGRTTVSWDVGISFGLGGGISYSEGKVEGLSHNVKSKDFSFDLGMNVGLGVASVDFNFYDRSKFSASLGGAKALPTIPGKIGVTVTPGSGQGYPQWTISKWDKKIQNENE